MQQNTHLAGRQLLLRFVPHALQHALLLGRLVGSLLSVTQLVSHPEALGECCVAHIHSAAPASIHGLHMLVQELCQRLQVSTLKVLAGLAGPAVAASCSVLH
jgi:hypothetical protein